MSDAARAGGPDCRPALLGAILAGGRASRLGGGDKTLLSVGGRTVLARIVDRLTPQGIEVVLCANGAADRFPGWAGSVVPDHPEDAGSGPLAGVLAILDWTAMHRPLVDTLLTVPSDTPFLPPDLRARLEVARGSGSTGIAFARSLGRDHPLVALWPVALRHPLRRALRDAGERRVGAFVDRHAGVAVTWPGPIDPFFNVNTPADLAEAVRRAS